MFIITAVITCSLFGFGIIANAQDVILKKDGSDIKSKVLEITDQQIKYKDFDFQSGPIRNINISEVFMITYENGQREVFNKTNESKDLSNKQQEVAVKQQEITVKRQEVTINGVTWATKNVGAFDSEDYGKYFTYSAALSACPDGWSLPTKREFESLNNAGSTWTTQNGKEGRKFGDSNNYIFLPAAGYSDRSLYNVEKNGHYWSSTPDGSKNASYLSFYSGKAYMYSHERKYGFSVRCVKM